MAPLWRSRKTRPSEEAVDVRRLRHRVRVSTRIKVSDDALLIRFDSADPSVTLAPFPAGAHLDVHIRPGLTGSTRLSVRLMLMSTIWCAFSGSREGGEGRSLSTTMGGMALRSKYQRRGAPLSLFPRLEELC